MVCTDTIFAIDLIRGNLSGEEEKIIGESNVSITSLSVVELIRGLHLRSNSKYISKKEIDLIKNILCSARVLSFDKETSIIAGEIDAKLTNSENVIGIEDIMIGAICIRNNEEILTKNKKHFKKMKQFGLKVLG